MIILFGLVMTTQSLLCGRSAQRNGSMAYRCFGPDGNTYTNCSRCTIEPRGCRVHYIMHNYRSTLMPRFPALQPRIIRTDIESSRVEYSRADLLVEARISICMQAILGEGQPRRPYLSARDRCRYSIPQDVNKAALKNSTSSLETIVVYPRVPRFSLRLLAWTYVFHLNHLWRGLGS